MTRTQSERVAFYARTAFTYSADPADVIDRQRSIAAELVDHFDVEIVDAGSLSGYDRLVELVEFRHIDVIVVSSLDRLARRAITFAKLIELCIERDVAIVAPHFDTRDAASRWTARMVAAIALHESEWHSERTRRGIELARRARGESGAR